MIYNNKKNGITLIEVMILISVVAILVSIIFPHISRAKAHDKLKICIQNQKDCAIALEQFKADHGEYPEVPDENSQVLIPLGWTGVIPDYINENTGCPENPGATYLYTITREDTNVWYRLNCNKVGAHEPICSQAASYSNGFIEFWE